MVVLFYHRRSFFSIVRFYWTCSFGESFFRCQMPVARCQCVKILRSLSLFFRTTKKEGGTALGFNSVKDMYISCLFAVLRENYIGVVGGIKLWKTVKGYHPPFRTNFICKRLNYPKFTCLNSLQVEEWSPLLFAKAKRGIGFAKFNKFFFGAFLRPETLRFAFCTLHL